MPVNLVNEHSMPALLNMLYGVSLEDATKMPLQCAALLQYIRTECTELQNQFIQLYYVEQQSHDDCTDKLKLNRNISFRIANETLHKLRSFLPPAPLAIPIEALGLSTRTYHALCRANIRTTNALVNISDSDLRKLKTIGHSAVAEIRQCVKNALNIQNPASNPTTFIDWSDIGICPNCKGIDHTVIQEDDGYGNSQYNSTCNNCGTSWVQKFHTIHINDGYENAIDSNGMPIDIIITNEPMIDIEELLHDTTLCKPCDKICAFNRAGICRYPLVYGHKPMDVCRYDTAFTTERVKTSRIDK